MALEWIKNNMLFADKERNRQLTGSELKVQQSLQKLSIPDWYLNKRSNPPKILNVMPTEHRLPSWKNPRKNCTSNSSSSDSIDILPHVKENVKEKTKKVAPPITFYKKKTFCQQMLPETKHTRSSTKSSSPKEEILDVNIPVTKFPKKISNTFPTISPSRKIQNINIVLPPRPKIEFSKDFEDMCNDDYNGDDSKETSVLKERPFNVDRTTKTEDLRNADVIIDKRRENRQTNVSFQASQAVTTPLKTQEKPNFVKNRAKSTPKSSQASEVVTTPLNMPDVKSNSFKYYPGPTPQFSQASKVVTTPLNMPDVKSNSFKYYRGPTPQFSQASKVVTTPLNMPDVKSNSFKYYRGPTPQFSQASKVVTTPLNMPDVKSNSFKYYPGPTPKFSQASKVVTTPLNMPDVKSNSFKYYPGPTPKFSQASKVVTTPLNMPDVKSNSFKYYPGPTPQFSQASKVVTTPLNMPDVKSNSFKYRPGSTPKFSQASEVVTTPLSTPDVKPKFFTYRVKSAPKFSQASEVVTTPLNTPDVKSNFVKNRAESTPKFSRTFEVVTTPLSTPDIKPKFFKLRANSTPKSSQSHLLSSAIIEDSPKEKILSPSILQKSLIFENKSMNTSNKSDSIRRSKKISPNLLEKTFIFENSSMHNSSQESCNPINLKLPLQSKQLNRKKNTVQGIIRDLDEKVRKSLPPRHSQDNDKERFVKQIVKALEKGDISRMRSISSKSSIKDEDSPSESETKSYVTSNSRQTSVKDTDYSDCGRRSLTLNSDDDQTYDSEYCNDVTLEVKEKDAKDDSVHWISIPRCALPRSSSLLSMISKLSARTPSPCISPIKSPNEAEYSLQTSWGATYRTSNALSRKLFHETVVIDSGYSD